MLLQTSCSNQSADAHYLPVISDVGIFTYNKENSRNTAGKKKGCPQTLNTTCV